MHAVPTFEHRELLTRALHDTRRRFLLITPHLRDAVVNQDLLTQLEVLLRRKGLTAHIAYGLGHPDREQYTEALTRLRRLNDRYPNLTVVRLRSAAPHCLVFDDSWINSSFDWLSFRGGAERAYRREEGTLIRSASIVDHRYAETVAAIELKLEAE
ncbi:hypothetical protein GCM10029964_087430 [Kibdelosporangium lantanae]